MPQKPGSGYSPPAMKSNLLPLLVASALLTAGARAQILPPADDFPNLPPGFMLPITPDGAATITGVINSNTDTDAFSFQVGLNGGVRIATTGTTDTNGTLKRQTSAGWTTVVSEEGGTGNFSISRVLDPGLYCIVVGGRPAANAAGTLAGAYVLTVNLSPPTPPAPGDIDLPDVPHGSTVAFGAKALNTLTSKQITVRNTGTGSLQVNGITLVSSNTPAGGVATNTGPFFIEGGAARTIAAGGSSTFRVNFRPTVAGNFTGTVNVASNDPDENPWNFIVTGSGEAAPPPGAPEIGLALGGQDVASGGTVDFGTIVVPSTASVVRELIISNTGTANLQLGAITLVELPLGSPLPSAPPGFFRVLSPPAPVVEPGRSTVVRFGAGGINIPLTPSPRYLIHANIQNSDADENPYQLLLSAQIETAPPPAAGEIAVFSGETELADDGTLDFGATPTGTPVERVVTIKNSGDADLRISGIMVEWSGAVIAIWPPPPVPFRVEGVEPRTVAPGASTSCRVIFPATTPGTAAARLIINNSDADENPFAIELTAVAEGVPPPPVAPEIAVSRGDVDVPVGGTLDFGRTPLTVPVTRTLTVSNTGTAVLQVRSAILPAVRTNAANAAGAVNTGLPFRFSGEMFTRVEPGARRSLSIVFQPRSNGPHEALLVISNNDRDENPYKVKLTGQGGSDSAAQPEIALSLGDADLPQGARINFGEVAPGTSVTREVRIANSGTGDLRLGRISFEAPPAPVDPAAGVNAGGILPPVGALPFRALPPPDNVVPAGRSAILRVVYMAPPSGSHTAVLVIESNDADESPYRLNLAGSSTGVVPAPPEIGVSAGGENLPIGGTLSFGVVAQGTSTRREIVLTNTGGGELRLSGFSILPAEFMANDALVWTPPNALVRVVSGPGVIAPGGTGTFVLEMMAFTPGPARLHARIGNNDPDKNPYSFAITGEVLAPPVVDPPLIDPAGGVLR